MSRTEAGAANPLGLLQFPIKKKKENPPELYRKTNVFIQHSAPGKYYSLMTVPRVICEPGLGDRVTVQDRSHWVFLPS